MTIKLEREAILSKVIADLKKEAKRRGKTTDWAKVNRDLRAFVAELTLAHSPVVRTKSGRYYYRVGVPTANVTEARDLLSKARKAMLAAESLPTRMSKFADRTYGSAGLTVIPWPSAKTYADALAELKKCLDTFEDIFKKTIAKIGKTQGIKGPLLDRVLGTPTEHFLQRLIAVWREASGSKTLGGRFQAVANQLLLISLPYDKTGSPPEIKDLKRQIENAKRRGPIVQTPWMLKTEYMNELSRRSKPRGRRQ
jgi:hypothetical protein